MTVINELQTISSDNTGGSSCTITTESVSTGQTVFKVRYVVPALGYSEFLIDGVPAGGIFPKIGQKYEHCPGVTIDYSEWMSSNTAIFRVDTNSDGIGDQPGERIVSVLAWQIANNNDFNNLGICQSWKWTVPIQPIPSLTKQEYAGTEFIPLCLFKLTDDAFLKGLITPNEARRVANTFESAIFRNPADGNPEIDSFDKWKPWWEAEFIPKFQWHRANQIKLFGLADDFFGLSNEQEWFRNTSWADEAITHVSETCYQYRDTIVGIEAMDEAGSRFSGNTGYADIFFAAWTSVGRHIPVSWPTWYVAEAFADPIRCDYVTRYPYQEGSWAIRGFLPKGGWTLPQTLKTFVDMRSRTSKALPYGCQISANEVHYKKMTEGAIYTPGKDVIVSEGWRPETIPAQFAIAAGYGARHFRTYHFDSSWERATRSQAPLGSVLSMGVRYRSQNWKSLVNASDWIRQVEQKLLAGHYREPVQDGPFFIGRCGSMEWVVNTTETPIQFSKKGRLTHATEFDRYFRGGQIPPGGVLLLS